MMLVRYSSTLSHAEDVPDVRVSVPECGAGGSLAEGAVSCKSGLDGRHNLCRLPAKSADKAAVNFLARSFRSEI